MKEPRLLKKDSEEKVIKSQRKVLVIIIVFVLMLFIGSSYSLLKNHDETEEVITFQTGELKMKVTSDNALNLEGELPKSDTEGFQNQEVKITLENTGTIEIGKYEVKLLDETSTSTLDEANDSILDDEYIRYSISEDDNKEYLKSDILTSNNNIIYTGYNLKVGEIKTIYLKVWLDEESGEAILSKSYNGKIKVELYQRGARDENLVNVVKSKLVSNYSGNKEDFPGGVVAVNTNGDLYNETKSEEIREYRYSGPSVNNYVTFNNELWRIIGVFKEGEEEFVKIVRNNLLENSEIPENYTINASLYNFRNNNTAWVIFNSNVLDANWSISPVSHYLNNYNDDATTSNYGYLHYLNEKAINMIRETSFYLGNATFSYNNPQKFGIIDSPKKSYINERDVEKCIDNTATIDNQVGCYIFSTSPAIWNGKIGLMYASDYGYSVNHIYWNTSMLLGTFDGEIAQTSWLQKIRTTNEWLITRPVSTKAEAGVFYRAGYLGNGAVFDGAALRPTLYLKSNVKIVSGTGEENNPYILDF